MARRQSVYACFVSRVWTGPGDVVVDVFLPDDDAPVDGIAKKTG
ncbi:hypothetical protein [Streptomyces sp. TLI_105]|nr:hypothetical protein [Streptomyces sp. TLI_105]SED92598.1 hypothetical protein SAMN05428939_6748 [Streptomyces sp. TLI_105]